MSDGLFRLDDRVAVVTGASAGLGARFAEALAGAGASVVPAARRAEELNALADRLPRALAVPADLRHDADRRALIEATIARFGRIDVLVNNAGIAQAGPAEDESLETFEALLATNTTAVFRLAQLAGRHMLAAGAGSIVNIASVSARASLDRYGLAGYVASKAAVEGLTRELARSGAAAAYGSTRSRRAGSRPPRAASSRMPIRWRGSGRVRRWAGRAA